MNNIITFKIKPEEIMSSINSYTASPITQPINILEQFISQDDGNKLKIGSDGKLCVLNEFETTQW